jgi:hypothetical protein
MKTSLLQPFLLRETRKTASSSRLGTIPVSYAREHTPRPFAPGTLVEKWHSRDLDWHQDGARGRVLRVTGYRDEVWMYEVGFFDKPHNAGAWVTRGDCIRLARLELNPFARES